MDAEHEALQGSIADGVFARARSGRERECIGHGARSPVFWRLRSDGPGAPRLQAQIPEKPINVVAVAVANHNARVTWVLVRRHLTPSPEGTEP